MLSEINLWSDYQLHITTADGEVMVEHMVKPKHIVDKRIEDLQSDGAQVRLTVLPTPYFT